MKKIISIVLALALILAISLNGMSTYAQEIYEEVSLNGFIDGIVELSQEYDAEKDFVFEAPEENTTIQFYSNGEETETQSDTEYDLVDFQTARLIVRANDNFDDYGAIEHISGFEDFHILQYESPKAAEFAYQELENSNKIESVHPDAILSNIRKSDISDSNQISTDTSTILCDWSLDRTQSKRLQDYLSESNGKMEEVIVGVVDTGVDYNHEFLHERIDRTYFNSGSDGMPNDEMDSFDTELCHGTAVSSVIVDNTPENVKIRAYKVLNEDDSSTATVICAGLLQAISDNVDVINMSMGFADESGLTQATMRNAYKNDIPVVTALGNYAILDPYDVACLEENIVVGATDKDNITAEWNNFSPYVDIVAPGEDINVAIYGNAYDLWFGTSFSAPCVAALAAIMKSFDKDLTVSEIERKIKDTSIDVVNDLGYGKSSQGNCMVQFCNALDFPKLASPQISLPTRTYEGAQTCIITCEDPSATILYTTDGTYPDVTTALEYSAPIEINEYTQIHAVAYYKDTEFYSDEITSDIRICYLGNEDDFTIDESGTITNYNGEIADLIIPEYINGIQVTDIGENAFTKETLIGITLPDSVTEISDGYKFKNNNSIRYISGNGVVTIGSYNFSNMSGIRYVDFPNLETIGSSAFMQSSTLISLNFPKLKTIGNNAFMYTQIFEFVGPEVIDVGLNAFAYCNSLDKVYLPKAENITNKRGSVFTSSTIADLYMPNIKAIPLKFCENTILVKADFPNAESIASSSFQYCNYLKYINLPKITDIPENAFISNMSYLNTTTIREYYLDNVVTIGENAFGTHQTSRVEFSNLEIANSLPITTKSNLVLDCCIITMPSTFIECTEDTNGRNYIIYGTEGTYAETWAEKNNHKFVILNSTNAILEDLPTEYYGLGEVLSPDVIGFNKTYQWYSNTTPDNINGTAIEGATDKEFNPADYPQAKYYYCVVTSTDVGYEPIEIRTGVTMNTSIDTKTILSANTSQIRFTRNDDGSFANKFDVRARAIITDADFKEYIADTNDEAKKKISQVGFVFTTDKIDFDLDLAQRVAKGENISGYTNKPINYIQDANGYYMFTCLVTNIPVADKKQRLISYAYICVDGQWYFYDTEVMTDFEKLYDTYYPLAVQNYGW